MHESVEIEKRKIKEYNYCIRCGRRLKSQENRLRGMGKTCYEKSLRERGNALRRLFEK